MMQGLLRKVFGSQNDRILKQLVPVLQKINQLEPEFSCLSDSELQAKTPSFRQRLAQGEGLDDVLPEAFAAVREASKRTLGQRHFDVQVLGGMMLHQGKIAEMKTGEGKTLVSTLPSYLNALTGQGVHVITVNDYLARRDAEWMGQLHGFMGLKVGLIVHDQDDLERKAAYAADITYGTNNEFGFDYLRDNMKPSLEYCVQRNLAFAIVDEVDSILIDEARTPLIISGQTEQDTQIYAVANRVIPRLGAGSKGDHKQGVEETGDYWVDEKDHKAVLTEAGVHHVERILNIENLYDPEMMPVLHAVNQALIAHTLKKLDVDYVVKAGETGKKEVIIVDEFTGRLMPGRRWSDGLHQAVEAKEGIQIRSENQTLASITFQNYFRMYDKISGMTGTADTEAPEFAKIYDLDVVVVPTNRPMLRKDHADVVYKTAREKFDAVIEEIRERHEAGQPVLVGTISIETSEKLARKLSKFGVKHNVLNAKQHEREAEIVAQAGRYGAVTISTNMAGRGTDIVLGGNAEMMALAKCRGDREHPDYLETLAQFEAQCREERERVLEAGGLHIIGTERHESRRIDNQLRGRSGRQGDPGSSRFYLSLDDNLLRIFESERVAKMWDRFGVEEGEAIEAGLLTRVIENAQKKVEARNFDVRKHLLEYDDVANKQRQAFYTKRKELLSHESVHDEVLDMLEGVLVAILDSHWPEKGDPDENALFELARAIEGQFGVPMPADQAPFIMDGKRAPEREEVGHAVLERLTQFLDEKQKHCDGLAQSYSDLAFPTFEELEKEILRSTMDRLWKDHLYSMDHLREGVSLRGYAQRDPKVEYTREGYGLFEEMNHNVDFQVMEQLFKVVIREPDRNAVRRPPQGLRPPPPPAGVTAQKGGTVSKDAPVPKAGRNDPCPCGSGKKYKKCHGARG